ncbi:DUF262 domain-containing protein [Streptomyces sp. NPDC001978]|uniref:DUF262 domain-containing protein n=1 Tax=Streptomyces sp. NPDC001978 TaxID=3364627 RepID=UPI00368830A0
MTTRSTVWAISGHRVSGLDMEAQEVSLHKVFSSDYDFRIPDYQRPYAWETEQATQLLIDLEEALERGNDEPYFLGSIVLVKANRNAHADVIDGQQRLTTLTILLALLRDLTEDPELRSDLNKLVIEPGNKVRPLGPRPRRTGRGPRARGGARPPSRARALPRS